MDQRTTQRSESLANLMRPSDITEFVTENPSLINSVWAQFTTINTMPPSLLLVGPPGVGKTSLARLLIEESRTRESFSHYQTLSAVNSGIKEIQKALGPQGDCVLLFIDELHRFTRTQQDFLLPLVEDGDIVLIGATTENPSFKISRALLSRLRVVSLPSLSKESLRQIIRTCSEKLKVEFTEQARELLIRSSDGDARRLLHLTESLTIDPRWQNPRRRYSETEVINFLSQYHIPFQHDEDLHYDLTSALIKSLRASDPEASLYWALRLVSSGEDPLFIFRRLVIFASEDIGNADPRALTLAIDATQAFMQVGLPEGEIPLAQCITYLATAPKSNRSYMALKAARTFLEAHPNEPIPTHLLNSTISTGTKGSEIEYRYPHNFPDAFDPKASSRPSSLEREEWYTPAKRGYEKIIKERMSYWKKLKYR